MWRNSCIEEREHLQVYLRVRPFTSAERSNGESQDCVFIEPPDTVLLKPPSLSLTARLGVDGALTQTWQRFQFSQVYGPETTQKELFEGTVRDLVRDVLNGGNSLVFTYGVTNAGKTFTFLGPDTDVGILPRSLNVIFSSIHGKVFSDMSLKPHRCREFMRLSKEQLVEEALFKRNLLRQFKESDKSNTSLLNSTSKTFLEGSSTLWNSAAAEDKMSLEVEANTKFSVWVSFCEIYNENIHDLLEEAPSGALRRTPLRLSQDVKGNAFVKDLRWVQVNTTEEAYKVMKLGKKNQSFSSTRLNQLSSRSHSIFSIRILRIEDIGTPRLHTVSELCLCDLAGSERCAKTQNKGERLKEAGNINTTLLILGKCINALRYNQQAKLLQHVPFRESKLTHYLQGFFCGRGKACMIVNVSQCASMYDETLNVLRFSAVAQKVVVRSSRPLSFLPQKSASEESSFICNIDGKAPPSSRRSSLTGWESSLEDVQENEDDECEEEQNPMEDTMDQTNTEGDGDETCDQILISKKMHQRQAALLKELQVKLKKEQPDSLLMESQLREEICKEFSDLFSEMQNDYNERLAREVEIVEERAERRLEIFKNLIRKMGGAGPSHDAQAMDCCSSELENTKDSSEAPDIGGMEGEEKRRLICQLQEKLSEIARLEKEVEDLQKTVELVEEKNSCERDKLQEALAALEKEKRVRNDTLTALECQTSEKKEALASLVEERKSKEEVIATLRELEQNKEEMLAVLEDDRKAKDEAIAALEEEKCSREKLQCEREKNESKQIQVLELEGELQKLKKLLEQQQLISDQFKEELNQKEASSKQEVEQLKKLLQEQETVFRRPLEELRSQLECQKQASREEVDQLRVRLEEQTRVSERQLEQHNETVKELKALLQQLEETKQKLTDQEAISIHLKQKLSEQEQTVEHLRAQLDDTKSHSEAEETLKRLNTDLQTEIVSLKVPLSNMMEKMEAETQTEQMLNEESRQMGERLKELQENLQDKEVQVTSLQKSLMELQERSGEEECQAVQEARSKEKERRRELLAVAHEAIAQKDEELEKRAEELNRLKEQAKQDEEKVKSLTLDLQRKEDNSSDLREKLADYKKQIQQVQKEISAMREEEKTLRQKLSDAEKTKKQLQSDLCNRDRTIQQLKVEQTTKTKSDQTHHLYQQACKDLEAKERMIEGMRLVLSEQEETQEQMEQALEEKLNLIQELSSEVEKLKGLKLQHHGNYGHQLDNSQSDDLKLAKEEAARAQESLKLCAEKHQAERKKWLEEKLSLIGQAKEAEDKRNQEMRKFAEDRERSTRQQSELESQLAEKEQTLEKWRKDRDTLVAALEVQLQKLLSSQAEKDRLIQQLRQDGARPQEDGSGNPSVEKLKAALSEREAEILQLQDKLKASAAQLEDAQTKSTDGPAALVEKLTNETITRMSGRRDTRASLSSRSSADYPSVLDSSEISTENGRTSRFPQPELEISFSPMQPNRMALRRQGEEGAVTVKITRSARKRKSGEMEKEEVEAENRRNTRTKLTSKLIPHKEESSSPTGQHDSPVSMRGRKEGTLQKIGDFLQSSPTLLGTKAKKMMSLVSGRGDADSAASTSSISLRAKKNKRKLYTPEISSPINMPSHPIISRDQDEKDDDHQIIKRRLRSRMLK
ncbi:kinesin-like protein KIF20B [Pholidichthys leucotaenia]